MELCYPVKSFDEKLYICETYHKRLCKNKIPCQSVSNKMALDPIPDELKDFKNRKSPNFLIVFKKIAIMHGKGEFSKIKRSI